MIRHPWLPFLQNLSTHADFLLSILFPKQCAHCHTDLLPNTTLALCPICQNALWPLENISCRRCGTPSQEKTELSPHCKECKHLPPSFRKARSLFVYAGTLRSLLHQWKYHNNAIAGDVIQKLFAQQSLTLDWSWESFDFVAPIPLHIQRLRQRGFNQSWMLLAALPQLSSKQTVAKLLKRSHDTPELFSLSATERHNTLQHTLHIHSSFKKSLQNKNILLIDDTYTTGTTTHLCALQLLEAGASCVDVLTLCRGIL